MRPMPLQERPLAVDVCRGRARTSVDDRTLRLELVVRLHAAPERPIRLLQPIGGGEPDGLHLARQLVARVEPVDRRPRSSAAPRRSATRSSPREPGPARPSRRPQRPARRRRRAPRRAARAARVRRRQDPLAEAAGEIGSGDRLEVVEERAAGERRRSGCDPSSGGRRRCRRPRTGRSRRPRDRGRRAGPRADGGAQLGDECPRGGMPEGLRRRDRRSAAHVSSGKAAACSAVACATGSNGGWHLERRPRRARRRRSPFPRESSATRSGRPTARRGRPGAAR